MITEQDVQLAEKFTTDPNGAHGIGFLLPEETFEPYPNGYWRSETVSGKSFVTSITLENGKATEINLPCGLGFYCHKCHLLYLKGAPDVIWHCGGATAWTEKADGVTHRLGSFVRYRTQTEKWKTAMVVVEDELKNIEAEKASRIDMLAPEPTLWDWIRNIFRKS